MFTENAQYYSMRYVTHTFSLLFTWNVAFCIDWIYKLRELCSIGRVNFYLLSIRKHTFDSLFCHSSAFIFWHFHIFRFEFLMEHFPNETKPKLKYGLECCTHRCAHRKTFYFYFANMIFAFCPFRKLFQAEQKKSIFYLSNGFK